ncbi:MAG: complex I NDUFA9 subunit family protein [Caulobacteraceae bacterium]
MKGLVTVFGGSGFLGSQIVRALARQGLRLRVAVRRPGHAYRLPMLGDVGQIEIVQANLRDRPSVARALVGAQGAINAVGVLTETGRQRFEALHAQGAAAVAEEARIAGVATFVHISALGADPDAIARYARTKAAGEAAVRSALPAAAIIRPSVVFGPDDHFFNRFAAMATTSPALPLIGGGATRFQPVYVGDVAAAVARILAGPGGEARTFELGGPAVYSFKELMALMLREIGRKRTLAPVPFAIAEVLGMVGDMMVAVSLPPPITSDQVALLRRDNIVSPGALGLAALDVGATAVEAIIPTYLWRYRKGGQYAQTQPGAALGR